ncbi:hypothetical protein EDD15DRAFT_2192525 [Pisolithus albus]|nr:hypothetical protein EDD15DRAFT_2192525 [Pisolithus albus]
MDWTRASSRRQMFECLPAPSSSHTRPRSSAPDHGVGHGQGCGRRIAARDSGSILALNTGKSVSNNKLKLFHSVQVQFLPIGRARSLTGVYFYSILGLSTPHGTDCAEALWTLASNRGG